MARYSYRRRNYRANRDKYSIENTAATIETAETPINGLNQGTATIVAPTDIQGMRKIKHITISASSLSTVSLPFYWAIVYVPEGYTANNLSVTDSLYEPNQYVMASGINDPDAGPIRIRSRLSRNLNSGDSIVLIIGTQNGTQRLSCLVSYAITLQ